MGINEFVADPIAEQETIFTPTVAKASLSIAAALLIAVIGMGTAMIHRTRRGYRELSERYTAESLEMQSVPVVLVPTPANG